MTISNKTVFAHEAFHQVQYQDDLVGTSIRLGIEYLGRVIFGAEVYEYPDFSEIERISDIPTLEGQATFIEHYALYLLLNDGTEDKYIEELLQYSAIVKNSQCAKNEGQ